jgi:hypothetical protein
MIASVRQAAESGIAQRLQELLPDAIVQRFVGGTRARRLSDDLLPSLSSEQIQVLRAAVLSARARLWSSTIATDRLPPLGGVTQVYGVV